MEMNRWFTGNSLFSCFLRLNKELSELFSLLSEGMFSPEDNFLLHLLRRVGYICASDAHFGEVIAEQVNKFKIEKKSG